MSELESNDTVWWEVLRYLQDEFRRKGEKIE